MIARGRELAQRRAALQQRAAAERAAFAADFQHVYQSVSLVDRAIGLMSRLGARPVLVAAGVGVMLLLGPARAISWVWRGYSSWTTARRLMQP